MSASCPTHVPLYILKWIKPTNVRGRSHMAVFVPNSRCKDIDPSANIQECTGTLLHVQGSPMTGFALNIRRNWDRGKTDKVGSVHLLSWVEPQYVPDPVSSKHLKNDPKPNGLLDQVAHATRPPGVSSPLYAPHAIFDHQDWVSDFMIRLAQRKIVDVNAPNRLLDLMDEKTALMAQPSHGSTMESALTNMNTASVARPAPQVAIPPTQPARGRYSSSEWDVERRAFRPYDHTAQQWELHGSDGTWKPLEQWVDMRR